MTAEQPAPPRGWGMRGVAERVSDLGRMGELQRVTLYTKGTMYALPVFELIVVAGNIPAAVTEPRARWLLLALAVAHCAATGFLLHVSIGVYLRERTSCWPATSVAAASTAVLISAALVLRHHAEPAEVVALAAFVVIVFAVSLAPALNRRQAVTGVLLALATVAFTARTATGQWPPPQSLAWLVISLVVFGQSFRLSLWLLVVVRELEQSRGTAAALAVAEERLRFGRDLHDTMGRSLSVIAVKASLAGELARRSTPGVPPQVEAEIAEIRELAQRSLREMREVVRGYRAVSLDEEIAGARSLLRAAGINCVVEGSPQRAAAPTVFAWVVREAVTNVLRHSRADHCTISVGATQLSVVNDGVPAATVEATGTGLAGLRERLREVGGTLEARQVQGEFVLVATVREAL